MRFLVAPTEFSSTHKAKPRRDTFFVQWLQFSGSPPHPPLQAARAATLAFRFTTRQTDIILSFPPPVKRQHGLRTDLAKAIANKQGVELWGNRKKLSSSTFHRSGDGPLVQEGLQVASSVRR